MIENSLSTEVLQSAHSRLLLLENEKDLSVNPPLDDDSLEKIYPIDLIETGSVSSFKSEDISKNFNEDVLFPGYSFTDIKTTKKLSAIESNLPDFRDLKKFESDGITGLTKFKNKEKNKVKKAVQDLEFEIAVFRDRVDKLIAEKNELEDSYKYTKTKITQLETHLQNPPSQPLSTVQHRTLQTELSNHHKTLNTFLNLIPKINQDLIDAQNDLTALCMRLEALRDGKDVGSDVSEFEMSGLIQKMKRNVEKRKRIRTEKSLRVIEKQGDEVQPETKNLEGGNSLSNETTHIHKNKYPLKIRKRSFEIIEKIPAKQSQLKKKEKLTKLQEKIARIRSHFHQKSIPDDHEILEDDETRFRAKVEILKRQQEKKDMEEKLRREIDERKMQIFEKLIDENLSKKKITQPRKPRRNLKQIEETEKPPVNDPPKDPQPNVSEPTPTKTQPPAPPKISIPVPQKPIKPKLTNPNPTTITSFPFVPSPKSISFQNFDPDTPYHQKITLTNVSSGLNTFRLLPIPIHISNYFSVSLSPTGRLSAGLTCDLVVTFHAPKGFERDISDGKIYFEAEYGGVFFVGVGCCMRKCLPRLAAVYGNDMQTEYFDGGETQHEKQGGVEEDGSLKDDLSGGEIKQVDFGACNVGESYLRHIEIKNDGAIPTDFEVSLRRANERIPLNETQGEQNESFSKELEQNSLKFFRILKNQVGCLESNSKITIDLEFKYPYLERSSQTLENSHHNSRPEILCVINFKQPCVKPIIMKCCATVVETPLISDKSVIDFKLCTVGKLYREKIEIYNRGSIALKFWTELPNHKVEENISASKVQHSESPHSIDPQNEDTSNSNSVWHSLSSIKTTNVQNTSSTNRSDILIAKIPEIGTVEISPRVAFVQAFEPFSVWVKIRPSAKAHRLLTNDRTEKPGLETNFFIKYINHGVEIPITCALKGNITTGMISTNINTTRHINPPPQISEIPITCTMESVKLGLCSTVDSKIREIAITNHSLVPQQICLTSSHPSLSIIPESGDKLEHQNSRRQEKVFVIVDMQPLSTIYRKIQFHPRHQGIHRMSISIQTLNNQKIEILCNGYGVTPYLKFDKNRINFAKTAIGSQRMMSIHLERYLEKYIKDCKVGFSFEIGEVKLVNVYKMDANGELSKIKSPEPEKIEIEDGQLIPSKSMTKSASAERSSRPSSSKSKKVDVATVNQLSINTTILSNPDFISFSPRKGTINSKEKKKITICLKPSLVQTHSDSITNPAPDRSNKSPTQAAQPQIKSPEKEKQSSARVSCTRPPANINASPNGGSNKPTDSENVRAEISTDFQDICMEILVAVNIRKCIPEQIENENFICGKSESKAKDEEISMDSYLKREVEEQRSKIYFSIFAPVIRPEISITAENLDAKLENENNNVVDEHLKLVPSSNRNCTVTVNKSNQIPTICFGDIPIGQRFTQKFTLTNLTRGTIRPICDGLNPSHPFEIVNALREIKGDDSFNLLFSFKPEIVGRFSTTLHIRSENTTLPVKLTGNGVIPQVSFEPKDMFVFMGDVVVGDTVTKSFTIHNKSAFPISCALQLSQVSRNFKDSKQRSYGTVNWNGTNAFSICQHSCLISENSKQEISLQFSPDRESDLFYDYVTVKIWGLSEEFRVKVHGRCWDTSSVLSGYDCPPESLQEDSLALPPSYELDAAASMIEASDMCDMTNEFSLNTVLHPETGLIVNKIALYSENNETRPNPPGTAGKDRKSKKTGKEKSQSKERREWLCDDDEVPRLLPFCKRRNVRFVVLKCPWTQMQSNNQCSINLKDLIVTNLKAKSDSMVVDKSKRSPTIEFTVEKLDHGFKYTENVFGGGFTAELTSDGESENHMMYFDIEPKRGTVDLGTQKSLKITLKNPIKEFWENNQRIKESIISKNQDLIPDIREMDRRMHIETCFKITLVGGYRYVEPKGVLNTDSRVWFIKIVTDS